MSKSFEIIIKRREKILVTEKRIVKESIVSKMYVTNLRQLCFIFDLLRYFIYSKEMATFLVDFIYQCRHY